MNINQKRKITKALLLGALAGFVIGGIVGYGTHAIINSEKQAKKSIVEQKETLGNQPKAEQEKSEVIRDDAVLNEEVKDEPTIDDFSDAVFIGDSRTDGLLINTNLYTSTFYTSNGLMVNTAKTKQAIPLEDGSKGTVLDALKQNSFQRVYVMFGVNELGWYSGDAFKQEYQELIQKIKEIQPEATIYIQSILPVTIEKSKEDAIYNNENVRKFNGWIQEVTAQENVTYIDVAQVIADENGNLPSNASSDGVHLTKDYYIKWLEYLRTIPEAE